MEKQFPREVTSGLILIARDSVKAQEEFVKDSFKEYPESSHCSKEAVRFPRVLLRCLFLHAAPWFFHSP